jgi:hypothetical protein
LAATSRNHIGHTRLQASVSLVPLLEVAVQKKGAASYSDFRVSDTDMHPPRGLNKGKQEQETCEYQDILHFCLYDLLGDTTHTTAKAGV